MTAEGVLEAWTVQFADASVTLRLRFSGRTRQCVSPAVAFLLLLTNIPLVANVLRKGSSMFSSTLVRLGGLTAATAGALLLIVDAWGLVLELLGAYPENFSEEALTTTYTV
jgi:hypothetical protein